MIYFVSRKLKDAKRRLLESLFHFRHLVHLVMEMA